VNREGESMEAQAPNVEFILSPNVFLSARKYVLLFIRTTILLTSCTEISALKRQENGTGRK